MFIKTISNNILKHPKTVLARPECVSTYSE